MSRLQEECRPILLALGAKEIVQLQSDQAVKLARWAVMFSMVVEPLHQMLAFTNVDERKAFACTQEISGNWIVWLSRNSCRHDPLMNHFGKVEIVYDDGVPSRTGRGIQTTAWGLAGLYFLTMFKTPGFNYDAKTDLMMPKIWPNAGAVNIPDFALNEVGTDRISREVLQIDISKSRFLWQSYYEERGWPVFRI